MTNQELKQAVETAAAQFAGSRLWPNHFGFTLGPEVNWANVELGTIEIMHLGDAGFQAVDYREAPGPDGEELPSYVAPTAQAAVAGLIAKCPDLAQYVSEPVEELSGQLALV